MISYCGPLTLNVSFYFHKKIDEMLDAFTLSSLLVNVNFYINECLIMFLSVVKLDKFSKISLSHARNFSKSPFDPQHM